MAIRPFEIEQGLRVEGDSLLRGNTTIEQSVTIGGDISITGNLLYTLEGTSDFIPTGAYALGSSSFRWATWATTLDVNGAANFTSNVAFVASSTARASARFPHGVAPTTPVNGDFWTTTVSPFIRINGTTRPLAFGDGDISGTANNATNFGGQLPAYYRDSTNLTGTIPSARLSGTYGISISGVANNSTYLGGQLPAYYNDATNLTGTIASARLTGSYAISISGTAATATLATLATNANTANNATNFNGQAASYYTNIPTRLGFTPVQQGTGTGQTANTIKIGWSAGSRLKATVDTTDLGNFVFDTQLATAAVLSANTANNSTNFNGQAASYYLNAGNLNAGTLPAARLTGTYSISIDGSANNSTNFNGQAASYYTNGSNISSGTVADARLPASMAGKTFTSDTAVSGTLTATTVSGTTLYGGTAASLPVGTIVRGNGSTTGGEILLDKPTSGSTLSGGVKLNAVGNKIQVFENGGTSRGVYIDLTGTAASIASYIWHTGNFDPTTKLGVSATAADSTLLAGQAASYYLNAGNLNAGTLPSGRLTGTYAISISGTAAAATLAANSTNFNGQPASYYTDIPSRLGFTPVQQGTGTGQTANTIKIGWSAGSRLKATVDTTDLGNFVFDSQLATAAVSSALTANNSTNLNGQAASYYLNAGNLNAGTLPSARLTGTYAISISGNAATATLADNSGLLGGFNSDYYLNAGNLNAGTLPASRLTGTYAISISGNATTATIATSAINANTANNSANFNGQAASYYTNASNIATGTLADARLPTSMAGKTFSSNTSVTGALTVTGDITAFYSSDRRLKSNIVNIPSALDKVKSIGGYTYTRDATGKREAGIIAQEIQQVLPEAVVTRDDGILAVDYDRLAALLIEAIKELAETTAK